MCGVLGSTRSSFPLPYCADCIERAVAPPATRTATAARRSSGSRTVIDTVAYGIIAVCIVVYVVLLGVLLLSEPPRGLMKLMRKIRSARRKR
jgi:hypothetical protein